MSTLIRTVIPLLVVLLLATACDNGVRYNTLRPNDVVLAFGNSLTSGTGAEEGQSYPAQLQELIRRKVVNAGVPGEITAAGRKRLPGVLDQYDPDFLILCHGGNDMLRRLDRKQTIANLTAMVAEAESRQIPVLLVAVPQLGLLLDPAPFYREIADQHNIPLENEIISAVLSDRALKSDTIHPNGAGYGKMAKSIADAMKKSGAL